MSPNVLAVYAPTPTPAPTSEPRPTAEPTNTPLPPTPIPGQPSLLVRNFQANPETTMASSTIILSLEVVNQGNRTAQGVSVSVDSGSNFAPANGQASALLPDISPGGTYSVTRAVIASIDTPAGPNAIPLSMAYHDFEGQSFTSEAALSVTITAQDASSQVMLSSYSVEPGPAQPGESVTLKGRVTNAGNQVASQVLLRVNGEGGVLPPVIALKQA